MSGLPVEPPDVMIVDDMPSTREMLKDMLHELGYRDIVEAGSGQEALEKLKNHGAKLILCDNRMKGMSGLELLGRLRNHPYLVSIPCIIVSSDGDVPIVEAALELGAADYIVKPISFKLLQRKIADVVRRQASPA
jgi:two-component system chemotaxis response regulator CheY